MGLEGNILGFNFISSAEYVQYKTPLKLSLNLNDLTAYKNEVKSTYKISDLSLPLSDELYDKINNDTTLNDKYLKRTLARMSDNAKIGDVIERFESTTTSGTNIDGSNIIIVEGRKVYYVVYENGVKERLKDRFKYFEYINNSEE